MLAASATSAFGFGFRTGTSMAAPFVAGLAARYMQTNPTASPSQVRDAIMCAATPDAVRGTVGSTPNLLASAVSLGIGCACMLHPTPPQHCCHSSSDTHNTPHSCTLHISCRLLQQGPVRVWVLRVRLWQHRF